MHGIGGASGKLSAPPHEPSSAETTADGAGAASARRQSPERRRERRRACGRGAARVRCSSHAHRSGKPPAERQAPPPEPDPAPAHSRAGRPRHPHRRRGVGCVRHPRGALRRACRRALRCRPPTPAPGTPVQVVVASVEGVDIVLPVARDVTTAVAYHPVDYEDTVPFSPAGERLERRRARRGARRRLRRRRRRPVLPHGRHRRAVVARHVGARRRGRAGLAGGQPRRRQGHGHQAVQHPRALPRCGDRHPGGPRPVAAAGGDAHRQASGGARRRGGPRTRAFSERYAGCRPRWSRR